MSNRKLDDRYLNKRRAAFFKRTKKAVNGCVHWTGYIDKKGYGRFGMWNRSALLAHRVVWYFKHGSFPLDCLLHVCDNRKCVNIKHLREGSLADNSKDRHKKGRTARGHRQGKSILRSKQVRQIRKLLLQRISHAVLAANFKVSIATIRSIRSGRNWAWLK